MATITIDAAHKGAKINKNLYGKLGVSSRKQLIAIAKVINE